MNKIDLHNYEAWFLDYTEKNLSEKQLGELNLFLKAHPELKAELEEFESINLHIDGDAPQMEDSFKLSLLREESTGLTRTEYLMIAEVEGTISKAQKAELAEMVRKQPALVEELGVYHRTKLSPKEEIVFTDKSELIQKKQKGVFWLQYAGTAAAAAIFAFLMWNTNTFNESYSPRGFAWQLDQEKVQENLSRSIVSEKEIEKTSKADKPAFYKKATQFAQEKSQKTPALVKKDEKSEIPMVVEPLEQEFAEDLPTENTKPKTQEILPNPITLIEKTSDNALANVQEKEPMEQEFVPIQKFAKDKIKKDLLKGKTFSETVAAEIADISNDKITFETDKKKDGLFENFALNIGKLSISRNR